jgi:hypothetical protein
MNRLIKYKYKGVSFFTQVSEEAFSNTETEKLVMEHIERRARYAVDVKPALDQRMKDIEDASRAKDAAESVALEHMRITLSLDAQMLLESIYGTSLVISNADLFRLRRLLGPAQASIIQDYRSQLDQSILRKYWEAEESLNRLYPCQEADETTS